MLLNNCSRMDIKNEKCQLISEGCSYLRKEILYINSVYILHPNIQQTKIGSCKHEKSAGFMFERF